LDEGRGNLTFIVFIAFLVNLSSCSSLINTHDLTIVTFLITILTIMITDTENKKLYSVLFGKSRRAVLSLLYDHSDEAFYLRQIVRATGIGLGPIQRELKQLTDVGILRRTTQGNQVYYQANSELPIFPELKRLVTLFTADINPPQSPDIPRISMPQDKISSFCKRHHIRKFSLFGSVLRDDFRPDSDVDVLVEFEPGYVPGFEIVTMENELTEMFGRKVDLRTPKDLSKYFREQVVREAKVQYEVT
jgi:hypothetical protein